MPNVSVETAAREWGVSRRTAYRLAEAGLVRVSRFGKRLTIPAEEVEPVRLEGVGSPIVAPPGVPLPRPRRGRHS